MFEVTYIVIASGVKITKEFPSPYLANRFANKIEHSKKCVLVSNIRVC